MRNHLPALTQDSGNHDGGGNVASTVPEPIPLLPAGLITLEQLLSEPEEEARFLVDGLLLTGGTSLIVAKPKVGKSTLGANLALAVAQGVPLLGREAHQGAVIYLALEDKATELGRTFRALGGTAEALYFWPKPAPDDAVEWLADMVQRVRPALLIVDTLQRCLRLPDLNDYAQVTNALEPLGALARGMDTHIAMMHHAKKLGGTDGDAVLGSTALYGAVDTLLEIRRDGAQRSIWSRQRYGEDLEESILERDQTTGWLALAGTRHEIDGRAAEAEVLALLATAAAPVTQHDVYQAVGGNRGDLKRALDALAAGGTVHREGAGKRGSPFLYSLPPCIEGVESTETWVVDDDGADTLLTDGGPGVSHCHA